MPIIEFVFIKSVTDLARESLNSKTIQLEYFTSTNAHHLLLVAILSRFLQMEPVESIRQTICRTIKRQFPTSVAKIQPLCNWFKWEMGMTNVATMTIATIRIWKWKKKKWKLVCISPRHFSRFWRNNFSAAWQLYVVAKSPLCRWHQSLQIWKV